LRTAVQGQPEAQRLTTGHRDPEQKRAETQTGGVGADSGWWWTAATGIRDTRYETCRLAGDSV
jgi:hypothetical protein